MAARQRLEIRVLGELSVRRAGEPVGLPASRKTRALLGYLVATAGTPQPRQRLCDLLWEGPVDPRGELRWSLSKLRGLLGGAQERLLRADRESVLFDPAGAEADVAELAALEAKGIERLTESELARAEALFRGELLAGLDLPDCFRFAAWIVAERERLSALHTALLERQVACLAGRPDRALRAARAWVAHDPLAEAAHAAVVRALVALGRPREANRQAETCRRILKQELGVAPGAELESARRSNPRVPDGGAAAAPDPAEPAPPADAGPAPFVGRRPELGRARAEIAAAAAARTPRLLLVSGESGIGKSRLLAELAAAVGAEGWTVLGGRGFEAELGRPYGIWIDLLREARPWAAGALAAAELAPLLAAGAIAPGPAPAAGAPAPFDRERLHGAVAHALAELGREAPLLIVVDDLQWVDEASVTLLAALLARGTGSGWVVAAGLRAGELGAQAPAAKLLRDLERAGRSTQLPLAALSIAASAELARAVAPEVDAEEIARASGGHPLFTVELARGGQALGAGLPASLAAAIGERLARLAAPARQLASWAAALGTAFEVETLRRLAGLDAVELLAGLEELERAALFRTDPGGERYDFAHDVVRRVAYEQIPTPRRRWLHAAIARSILPRLDRDDGVAVSVAHHAALGGESELAARACLAAAERCLRLAAVAEAGAHCESGLGHLARADELETLALRLGLLRALVHATQGRPRRGLAAEVGRWVEVARRAGRLAELQIGLYLQAALFYAEGDLSEAERQVLAEAEALRGAEPQVAARALSNAGRCLAQIERDHARAEALLRDGRILAERAGIDLIDVPWGLGMLAQAAGRADEARRELGRAVELARRAGDPWIESQCLSRLAAMALEHGEAEPAIRWSEELQRLEAKVGAGTEGAIAAGVAALARWGEAGESGAAAEALERAIAALRTADSKSNLAFVLNQAASRELASGRPERAAARAREALAAAVGVGRKGQIARAHLLLAQVAVAGGDPAAARREIEAAIEQNRPPGALGGRAWSEIEACARQLRVPTLVPTPRRQSLRRAKGERR